MDIVTFVNTLPPEQKNLFLSMDPQEQDALRTAIKTIHEKGYTPASLMTELVRQMPDQQSATALGRMRRIVDTRLTVGHVLLAAGAVIGLVLLKMAISAILRAVGVHVPFFNPAGAGEEGEATTFASGASVPDPLAGSFAGAPALHV